jgi:tetratricopeptide (TPR) repeat protein
MCATVFVAGSFALVALVAAPPFAWANCAVSAYYPSVPAREAAMIEAGGLASNGHLADARAVYLWVLARHDSDAEALFGLARVDAWGGCWAIAEEEYRRVLAVHPADADVRAGYVDLLLWRGRRQEAERVLMQGLSPGGGSGAIGPASEPANAPSLLARAARFAYWRGDAATAVRLGDEAERVAPDDGDVRAMRDRMFLGEARLTTHVDVYPSNYPSLYSVAAQVLERKGRFELSAGAQLLERLGGGTTTTVLDLRYPLGVAYHPALGVVLGAEIAPGFPAHAIPGIAAKVWALAPLAGPFDAFLAYSLWHFAGDDFVHIINPSLGVALPADLRLEGRAWISWAILGGHSQTEGALGSQLIWSPTSRLSAGVTYTYGAEVNQVPTLYQLLEYRSHVGGLFADVAVDRRVGVRPLLGISRREGPASQGGIAIWIASFEIGAYARW